MDSIMSSFVILSNLDKQTLRATRLSWDDVDEELNKVSKSFVLKGDFLSVMYMPSLDRTKGGRGSLSSWMAEYALQICSRVRLSSAPVFCFTSFFRFFMSILGS